MQWTHLHLLFRFFLYHWSKAILLGCRLIRSFFFFMILMFGGFVGWIPESMGVEGSYNSDNNQTLLLQTFFFCTSANFLSTRPLEIVTKLTHTLVFVCRASFAPFLFSAFFWTPAMIIHSSSLSLFLLFSV